MIGPILFLFTEINFKEAPYIPKAKKTENFHRNFILEGVEGEKKFHQVDINTLRSSPGNGVLKPKVLLFK